MKTKLFLASLFLASASAYAATIDFEDLSVPGTNYYNGSDGAGSFISGGATFNINYDSSYGSWYGIAYSNLGFLKPAYSDYGDQYGIAAAAAASGSNYGVIYDPTASFFGTAPRVEFGAGMDTPISIDVTNNSYGWATMTYGGFMVDPFGTGDWFKLTITGLDATDASIGSVDVFLADFTNDNSYILDTWTTVDLTSLGSGVSSLTFTFTSSDTGAYGMNNPAYAAIDNLRAVPEPSTYAAFAGLAVLGLTRYRKRR
ncbi:MAG: DUF4465 domain-containing protein [Opitutales bacterium]|jgi:hypothetical protein